MSGVEDAPEGARAGGSGGGWTTRAGERVVHATVFAAEMARDLVETMNARADCAGCVAIPVDKAEEWRAGTWAP